MAVGSGQATSLFVKKETTRGVLVPPAGTDAVPIIADADLQQLRNTAQSLVRVNSYSLQSLLSLRYGAGSFTIPFYMMRTGVADSVVPGVDTIIENFMGRKTISAGVSVTYNCYRLQDPLLTMSVFYGFGGGTVLQAAGGFINDFTVPFVATPDEAAITRGQAAGSFYRMYWAGQTTINADLSATDPGLSKFAVLPADLIPFDGTATAAETVAGKFTVGAYIKVGALTTSHKITAINPTTGVVTVTPVFGSSQASGSTVGGFMPTSALTGLTMSAHQGFLKLATVDYPLILSGTPHAVIPRRALVEAKNNSDYATDDAWEGKRVVTIDDLTSYYDPVGTPAQDLDFALSNQLTNKAVELNFGKAVGNIFQFNFPQGILKDVRISGEGLLQMTRGFDAFASAALDDELNIVSK